PDAQDRGGDRRRNTGRPRGRGAGCRTCRDGQQQFDLPDPDRHGHPMNNLNADFLLDIWADIKAKKLAPIAIGLVVAMVAMPALLLTGGGAPDAGPVPVLAPASADAGEVELAQELAEN